MSAREIEIRSMQMDLKNHSILHSNDTRSLQRHCFVSLVRKSPAVFGNSIAWSATVVALVFVAAHIALLVGVTAPEKFHFDEVQDVPAARQIFEPVIPGPMLNPMDAPLTKQLMAVSIRVFEGQPV